MSTRAPLGSKPMKLPGPANVARARQRTAARSPSATMLEDLEAPVGERRRRARRRSATHLVAADRPGDAVDVARARRARSSAAGRRARRARAPRSTRARRAWSRCSARRRWPSRSPLGARRALYAYGPLPDDRAHTQARGRPRRALLPGVWRLRLPLPWPGVPHCNAWAVAAGDGIVLFDTGMHEPGSMANLERALDMVGLKVEHVRLLVCTHAHSDHYGQAATIVERAGCELWMHPDHAPHDGRRRRSRRGARAPAGGRALGRRARGAAAPMGARRARASRFGIAGIVEPDRDLLPGVDGRRPTSGRGRSC